MMKLYKLHLKINGLPKSINSTHGRAWQVKHAECLKWKKLIHSTMLNESNKTPPVPLEKATLSLIRHSSRCPDYDGLVSTFKPVIDGLKKLNIILDDSMDVIGKPNYDWKKAPAKAGFIEITVTEED